MLPNMKYIKRLYKMVCIFVLDNLTILLFAHSYCVMHQRSGAGAARSHIILVEPDPYRDPNLKFILNSNYFKMAFVWVHFSPGFPLGEGFPAEQFFVRRFAIWRIFSKVYKQCCNPDHDYRKMREAI
jgi:hypothetical protein